MNFKCILLSCLLLVTAAVEAQTYSASNFTMVGQLDPETNSISGGSKYSGCWGWYQATTNKEYAIAGSVNGTYWVDITIPSTPTVCAYRAGKSGCTWREIKSYQNYCYVISDDPGANSFQIFDMQYLPDSVHKVYDSQALFTRGHTLWIDGNKLYVAGVSQPSSFSTMNVYDLTNPASPTLIRQLDQDYGFISYVHDMYVRNDTVYASCAYQGLNVFKLMANNTFSLIGSLSNYPFSGYNHSSALTPNGQTLVFMDEVPSGLPIKIADVTNLGNIQVLATANQFPQTTPHNPFMINNQYCLTSCYQDGLQLYDISIPGSPFIAGFFDTYPQAGGNNNTWISGDEYNGQWGAYPYYPSKSVFALDRQNGIFILNSHLLQSSSPPPVFSAGFSASSSTACVGSTINFMNTSTAATNYTWSFTGGSTSNATSQNLNLTFALPGTYSVTLHAVNSTTSANVTQTVHIVNNTLNSTMSFTNPSCNTCNTGVLQVNISGGTAPYSYTWQPSGGNSAIATNLAPDCYTVSVNDASSCSYSAPACINMLAGIPSFAASSGPLVHPNPAQSVLTIDYPGSVFSYTIYNIIGKLVSSNKNNQQKVSISVNEFPKGIYIVEIESGKTKTSQKIIIE